MTSPDAADGAAGQVAVSIIIPVHNKAFITRQCLEALLAEPADEIEREIIVVDDGSADATPAMLAEFGERIRVIRNESALGFAGACNAGAAAARHDLFVLLNNDTIPTQGWLAALVNHALLHPAAAVVGAKLLFPNDTIQHAGVVFGLDLEPHHIYAGFPAAHPASTVTRPFQAVTAACALFRRQAWEELGGLSTDYRNGWEDVDYCMRAGEAGHEIHYCAECVVYHFESATRDLLSATERANRALFGERWRDKIDPDDFGYYWADGLISAVYGARYPIQLSLSPLLAGVVAGDNDRQADKLLYERARQVMILLRNNIILNVRVQDAEARAAAAERRLQEALARLAACESEPATEVTNDGASAPAGDGEETVVNGNEAAAQAAAEERAPLPHQIVGLVESPGRLPDVVTDGNLIVSGWILTAAGDATIEAIVDGVSRGVLPYGEPRPEVETLYPNFPAGANCGFQAEIAVGDLPDGMHELTIRVSASDGSRAQLSTTFEVDSRAFETGRVIGRIDVPVRGAIFVPREVIPVSGWVLAPSGIKSLETLVDGEPRGRVDYRVLRPDIARRQRQYPDADHCGFSGTVPLYGLGQGSHELVIRATANDGQQLELATRIEVDTVSSIDGGLAVINRQYRDWLERRAPAADLQLDSRVSFEVLVPLEGDCGEELEVLAGSLRAQTHPAWRFTLVDAGASEDAQRVARELAAADERMTYREATVDGLAGGLNRALAESRADWVVLLRPGVLLSPAAFARIAASLSDTPQARLVYTDDDRIDPETTERWNPFFKPDWSPDLQLAMNYLGPLTVFQRQAALAAGGFRAEFAEAAVYDLALRVTDQPVTVQHIAEVLVTTIERAPQPGEPWYISDWREGERLALVDTLARRGDAGTVERGMHPGAWRVRYALPDPPGVTAVIPTGGNLSLLRPCLEDLLHRTDYPRLEILLVDNSGGEAVAELVAKMAPHHPNLRRVVDTRKPFNYSALINAAMPHVATPYVLMLNDDITVIEPGWLRAMVEQAQRPEVGIVGAKLLYPDNTIQHAGVILGPFGGSVHIFKRHLGEDPGFFGLPNVVRNCSAVTFACAVIDSELFTKIGGLDEVNLSVAFNDTDFCLRAREAGFEVIYTPHATLYHHESVTKTVIAHPHEIAFLRNRWGHVIKHDPYYNPNLTRKGEDARLDLETSSAA